MKTYSRVYAAINLDAVLHNLKELHAIIAKDCSMIAVVKADGYGHGAVPIAKEMEHLDFIWGYATATVEEATILRRSGLKKNILVFGTFFPEQAVKIATLDIRPTVLSFALAKQLSMAMEQIGKDLSIHVKIDTGLSRVGYQVCAESATEIEQISRLPHIIVEGMYTHFAKADAADKSMALAQLDKFEQMNRLLKERNISIPLLHCSNSAAIIDLKEANKSLVRAGISLYGLWPSDEVKKENLDLHPALELKSQIVYLKKLKAGRTISYGATYTAEEELLIATIPIGYGDGYPRALSNKGHVLIRGQKAPICGRICMDQFMVDVTHIEGVKNGDTVTLVGTDQKESITMEDIGDLSGRFNYEFACGLGKRIPRVYYKNNQVVGTKDYFDE
ncbi:alanine racemase [Lachnospiraceae bacterium ZAX-1]